MAIVRKPAGPTVEEARAAMIAARQVPKKLREHDIPPDKIELPTLSGDVILPPIKEDEPDKPGLAEQIIAGRPSEDTPEIPPAPKKKVQPEVERLETDRFTFEMRQENGEWVGQIEYKNGAGTERFSAPTKNALILKMGEGKANATLRVREAVRREKIARQPNRLPDLPTDPEELKRLALDSQEGLNTALFLRRNPDFWDIQSNSDQLLGYLRKQNWQITVDNLELAFEDLKADELLTMRPRPEKQVTQAAKVVEDSTPELDTEDEAAPVSTEKVVTPPAPPPAPAPRKRGTSGLKPEHSSASDVPEESDKPAEPSVAETRTMPFDKLARIVQNERRQRSIRR